MSNYERVKELLKNYFAERGIIVDLEKDLHVVSLNEQGNKYLFEGERNLKVISMDDIARDGYKQIKESEGNPVNTVDAFLADVNETHIIYNAYEAGELERVLYAAELIKKCPLYIKKLPDFSMKDIENTIKFGIHEWDVRYVFFDLDGTLTDPKEGITKSVAYALKSFGIHVDNLDDLCKFIGPPLKWSFMEYYGFDEELKIGDLLLFGDMAIYTMCKNNTFNGMPLPNIWKRDSEGRLQQLTQFGYRDFKGRVGKNK